MIRVLFIAAIIWIVFAALNRPNAVDDETLRKREKRRLKLKKKD